jgi:hypothetical protein
MNATERNEVQPLNSRQLRAVDMLIAGMTNTEVAAEIGVDRTTVWRWGTDPFFRAELARRRHELWNSMADRMRALLPRAFDAFEKALDEGNWRAALAFLKLAGISDLSLDAIGSTDPDAITRADAMNEEDQLVSDLQVELMRVFPRQIAGLR